MDQALIPISIIQKFPALVIYCVWEIFTGGNWRILGFEEDSTLRLILHKTNQGSLNFYKAARLASIDCVDHMTQAVIS